jgi:hypothetical protein
MLDNPPQQDHQKTTAELKVETGKVKASLPTALDSEHQKMLDDLKSKTESRPRWHGAAPPLTAY